MNANLSAQQTVSLKAHLYLYVNAKVTDLRDPHRKVYTKYQIMGFPDDKPISFPQILAHCLALAKCSMNKGGKRNRKGACEEANETEVR